MGALCDDSFNEDYRDIKEKLGTPFSDGLPGHQLKQTWLSRTCLMSKRRN